MVSRIRLQVALSGLLLCMGSNSQAQSLLERFEQEVAGVVQKARSGVVAIEDERTLTTANGDLSKGERSVKSPDATAKSAAPFKSGTGFCYDGYIVTTADVLEGMQNPLVLTDSGIRFKTNIVTIDPELNIGVLRLPPKCGLPSLTVGDSATVKIGHFAIPIGNQNGQINAVTLAVVSSLKGEGSFSGKRFYSTLIQVAGTLGAGSSGAPLLNTKGEVIGMMAAVPQAPAVDGSKETAKPAVTSAGYAIPINDLKDTLDAMLKAKLYARAWVGMDLREVSKVDQDSVTVRVEHSVHVLGIYPGSPAERAGLKVGDVLVSMNGKPVQTLAEFRTAIVRLHWPEPLVIEANRAGKPLRFSLKFETRPPDVKEKSPQGAPGGG